MISTITFERIFQKIGTTVDSMIPEDWTKAFIYACVDEESIVSFFYYYIEGDQNARYSLDILKEYDIDQKEFDELENTLCLLFNDLWHEFKKQNQEPWTNLTMILYSTGRFEIDYEYLHKDNINRYEEQIIWEYKYLKKIPENNRKRDNEIIMEYIKNNS